MKKSKKDFNDNIPTVMVNCEVCGCTFEIPECYYDPFNSHWKCTECWNAEAIERDS